MEDKLNYLSCPVCEKDVYSSIGKGCKMCGMVLDDSDDFCCEECRKKYNTIRKNKRGFTK